MVEGGKSKDVITSEEESRRTRSTSRKDLEAQLALFEQKEKMWLEEQDRLQEEYERKLAEKDQTIADMETEISTLQNRLYEYEVKQTKILKDVGEMKENVKKVQERSTKQKE